LQTAQNIQIAARPSTGLITSARWSPDGSQIAFTVYDAHDGRDVTSEVMVAGANGSDPRSLIPAHETRNFYQSPVWRPDSNSIYVLHTWSSGGRVEQVAIASGEAAAVVEQAGIYDVSPDGRWPALIQQERTGSSITAVDLMSDERQPLVSPPDFAVISVVRSDPTSAVIAFSGSQFGADARPQSIPGSVPGAGRASDFPRMLSAVVAPALASAHGPPQDVFTVGVANSLRNRVASLKADDPFASWSPDGSQLAVLAAEYLAMVPTTGGNVVPIIHPGAYGTVDWLR
jgi:Tol biopolymer transport system component